MCTGFSGSAQRATLDFGAASGVTLEGGTWLRSQTGVSTTVCDSNSHSTNILELADNSTPVVNATANVTAMTAGFELTWSGTLSVSYQFNYMALRETGAAPGTVLPELLTNTPVLPNPGHTREISILPGLLSNAPSLSAPTISLAATIEPALLSNTPALSAPTLLPGGISVLPAALVNAPELFIPGITVEGAAEQTVGPPPLVNAPVLNTPTFVLTLSIEPTLLANTPSIGSVVLLRTITIQPALLSNAPSLAGPVIEAGTRIVQLTALFLNTPILSAPLVSVAGVTETWTQAGERTHLINPANHPSSTVYELDGVLWSSAEGNPAKMRLMYLVGAVWTLVPGAPTLVSTVVSSDPPSVTGVPARVRSAAFALVAGAQEYRFERSHIPGAIHNYEDAAIRGSG